MPPSGTQFKNKVMPLTPEYVKGLFALQESGLAANGDFQLRSGCRFAACTGNTDISDATPGQIANITLIPASVIPYNTRCYLTRCDVDVQGDVSWSCTSPSGVPYLSVQDTNGVPLVHFPFNALRGISSFRFPDSDCCLPLLLGPSTAANAVTTFAYSVVSGFATITASASVFVSGILIGTPVQIIDGTGKGQSAIVTGNTATVLTLNVASFSPVADVNSSAADSVLAVFYQPLHTYSSTTSVTIQNGGGTPFTANTFDNGFNLIGVAGAGAGQVRAISANTNAGALTLSFALNTAMNTTTTLVQVANDNTLQGAVDLCVGDKWAVASQNAGIQLAVNLQTGTTPLGSSVRVFVEGFFAA